MKDKKTKQKSNQTHNQNKTKCIYENCYILIFLDRRPTVVSFFAKT